MISRRAKELFYTMVGPVMRLNGAIYRASRAPQEDGKELVRVHLGPGQSNYLAGWINVDANVFTGKCDVWSDISKSLCFRDSSVDAIYSHHVIEHLPDLFAHFREMFRIMKPGGVFRVGGPNGDSAVRQYLAGNKDWFPDFPDARTSIGGRLENYVFCRQEHLTILTPSFLEEIASAAGFINLKFVLPVTESVYPEIFDKAVTAREWQSTPECPHTLLLEGTKPHESSPSNAPQDHSGHSQHHEEPNLARVLKRLA